MDGSADVVAAWMHLPVRVVDVDERVADIRSLMLREGFHHVLVEENGRVVGVISDRDVLRAVSPRVDSPLASTSELATLEKRAHQVMGRSPVTVAPDSPMREAARLLLDHRTHCLPVLDGARCRGILTTSDVMRWAIALAEG